MGDCIATENLKKDFRGVHAVRGISLHVREGEIYGFLGLNGAGKTTTIRMLLGMIAPTSGSATLYGQRVEPGRHDLWSRVGYMVEIPNAYPDLTVRENLEIIRRLRLLPDGACVDAVMERLRIAAYRDRPAKHLSLGNAQRLGLAKALIHKPDLLLLDEPANGLDPAGIVEIRELLRELARAHGVTVFISSHILGEIAKFADRIGIIHQGELIQEIEVADLDRLLQRRLEIRTRDNNCARSVLERNDYPVVAAPEELLTVKSREALDAPDTVASILVEAGCAPTMLKVEGEDLEAYFLRTITAQGVVST